MYIHNFHRCFCVQRAYCECHTRFLFKQNVNSKTFWILDLYIYKHLFWWFKSKAHDEEAQYKHSHTHTHDCFIKDGLIASIVSNCSRDFIYFNSNRASHRTSFIVLHPVLSMHRGLLFQRGTVGRISYCMCQSVCMIAARLVNCIVKGKLKFCHSCVISLCNLTKRTYSPG